MPKYDPHLPQSKRAGLSRSKSNGERSMHIEYTACIRAIPARRPQPRQQPLPSGNSANRSCGSKAMKTCKQCGYQKRQRALLCSASVERRTPRRLHRIASRKATAASARSSNKERERNQLAASQRPNRTEASSLRLLPNLTQARHNAGFFFGGGMTGTKQPEALYQVACKRAKSNPSLAFVI